MPRERSGAGGARHPRVGDRLGRGVRAGLARSRCRCATGRRRAARRSRRRRTPARRPRPARPGRRRPSRRRRGSGPRRRRSATARCEAATMAAVVSGCPAPCSATGMSSASTPAQRRPMPRRLDHVLELRDAAAQRRDDREPARHHARGGERGLADADHRRRRQLAGGVEAGVAEAGDQVAVEAGGARAPSPRPRRPRRRRRRRSRSSVGPRAAVTAVTSQPARQARPRDAGHRVGVAAVGVRVEQAEAEAHAGPGGRGGAGA